MSLSRRDLVSALGAGSLPAQAQAAARLGVIGLGARSRAHFAAFKSVPEARVTALCDLDSQQIDRVNRDLPAKASGYTDYRELIADRNVDAVIIVAPNFLHRDMALAALRAGKDVLVEKPLALTCREAKEVADEARRSGRIMAVGMQRRYAQPDARILELVQSGRIGKVELIVYAEHRGDWNPNSWKYTDSGVKTNWRFLRKTAGSTELEMCVHSCGFIYSLLNSPLARLTASGGAVHFSGRETRDVSAVLAEFQNGARVQHSLCMFARGVRRTCDIIGQKGSIELDGATLTIRGGAKPEIEEVPDRPEAAEVPMYRDFIASVRSRRPPALSPDAAIEPSKIAYAAEISIAEGRTVTAADFR
jgi:predicted dehydrogenase